MRVLNTKFIFILIYLFTIALTPKAQQFVTSFNHGENWVGKPALDTSVLTAWPRLRSIVGKGVALSSDGDFMAYTIENMPVGGRTLIVRNIKGSWQKEFIGVDAFEEFFFSKNSQLLIFKKRDTLNFLTVLKDKPDYISGVVSFKVPKYNKGEWIAYKLNSSSKEIELLNLLNGNKKMFSSVTDYLFDDQGSKFVFQTSTNQADSTYLGFKLIELPNIIIKDILAIKSLNKDVLKVKGIKFDGFGNQLLFWIQEKNNNSIWYYSNNMREAALKIHNDSRGIDVNLEVLGNPSFSKNGQWIFFELQEHDLNIKPNVNSVKVNVWSYKDIFVQPRQELQAKRPERYIAVLSVTDYQVIRITRENEQFHINEPFITGDFVVVVDNNGAITPNWWPHGPQPCYWLVSLRDGKRKMIKLSKNGIRKFSPTGKYLIYWDEELGSYISYNVKSGITINMTKFVSEKVCKNYICRSVLEPVADIAGWFEKDSAVLIYDNYDIWQVDPDGKKPAINITHGFGKLKHVKLRIAFTVNESGKPIVYKGNESLLLTAFNDQNKYNGFYNIQLGKNKNPYLLTMGPYVYYRLVSQLPAVYHLSNGMQPIKAQNANIWIIQRESATEAPNYFFTSDFKSFTQITNLRPQSNVNWLKSELIVWKMFDGRYSQGVLYKPENFNPKLKYPIIFNFYEALSQRLYEFPFPGYTGDNINIAWFVSNGYLVFTPDIHYFSSLPAKNGKTSGQYAYNSIISAAKHLTKFPYVDKYKMAIQGHSFGGYETSYLVTHSSLFAAACEVAGFTDPISSYLSLVPIINNKVESDELQDGIERGHLLYLDHPWNKPLTYRLNSAVLNVDKITTPVLIMHNVKDDNVPWRQGLEFYLAMRRLGKASWMLQYENGTHGLDELNDLKDFTIRITQFFDHYLKGSPAPVWMTNGIPAKMKGVETGYGLTLQNCSKKCQICEKRNAIHKKTYNEVGYGTRLDK